ncbi:MAG TPA: SGNH/GDSL hydrolase family protein [Cellulomonas sp.]
MAALRPVPPPRAAAALLALGALALPWVDPPPALADVAADYRVTVAHPADGAAVEGLTIQAHGMVVPTTDLTPWMDVMLAVDVSGSTSGPTGMDCNGDGQVTSDLAGDDLNADGNVGDVLDCEIGAVVALTADLRTHPGAADRMGVAITGFGTQAVVARLMTEEMQRKEEETQQRAVDPYWVAPGATGEDRDVLPRVSTVAAGLLRGRITQYEAATVGTGTSFRAVLTTAVQAFAEREGSAVLLLLSDGQADIDPTTLDALTASGIRTRTFAIGAAAGACGASTALARIAAATGEECTEVADPAALTTSLVGSGPAGLAGVEVTLGGETVTAEVDALGRWSADLTASRTGRHTLVATATYADGSTSTTSSGFRVTDATTRYVALGDSYASGEGIEPYTADDLSMAWGIVPATEDYLCHRSPAGWPTAVTLPDDSAPVRDLAGTGDAHQFVSTACSGARMVNLDTVQQVKLLPYVEDPEEDTEEHLVPRQLDSLTPDTDLVTISIGGNDIGFAPIVMHCLTQLHCQNDGFVTRADGSDLSLHDWASIRLALIGAELSGTYAAITDRTGPDTAVVALTYPRLVAQDPSTSWQITCRPATLQNDEREWLRGAADAFADVVHQRAAAAGVRVADVRDVFEGHLVCDGDEWLFAAQLHRDTDLPDSGLASAASFHPNEDGVAAYTEVVNAAVEDALADQGAAATFGLDLTPTEDTTGVGPFDPRVVTDPDAVLVQFSAETVEAVRATMLGTATALAAQDTPCEAAGAGERVPVAGGGFAAGSEVQATLLDQQGAAISTATVRASSTGIARTTLTAPDVIAEDGLVGLRLDGTGATGGTRIDLGAMAVTADVSCAARAQADAAPAEDAPAPATAPGHAGASSDPEPAGIVGAGGIAIAAAPTRTTTLSIGADRVPLPGTAPGPAAGAFASVLVPAQPTVLLPAPDRAGSPQDLTGPQPDHAGAQPDRTDDESPTTTTDDAAARPGTRELDAAGARLGLPTTAGIALLAISALLVVVLAIRRRPDEQPR